LSDCVEIQKNSFDVVFVLEEKGALDLLPQFVHFVQRDLLLLLVQPVLVQIFDQLATQVDILSDLLTILLSLISQTDFIGDADSLKVFDELCKIDVASDIVSL